MMDNFCKAFCILIVLAFGCEGQQNETIISQMEFSSKPSSISVPFCDEKSEMLNIIVPFFDSNETHIYMNGRNISTNFTWREEFCPSGYSGVEIDKFEADFIIGFNYNSSLINVFEKTLIPPAHYCWKTNGTFIICIIEDSIEKAEPNITTVYVTCLIISTICYFGSAIIYYFVLKVQDDHKKCFIGYSLSMGTTFLVLVILQVVNTMCNVLGSLFFIFVISSFAWLSCLCADLNLMIRNFREEEKEKKFYLYVSFVLLYSCSMMTISLLIEPLGSPDVPKSFIKQYTPNMEMCSFEGHSLPMFFVPTGLLILLSIALISNSCYLIWLNEKQNKNNFIWLEKRSDLRYMLGSCSLLIFTTGIWIIDISIRDILASVPNEALSIGITNLYILDSIEASLGIFAVAIFVLNRYTRREIRDAMNKTNKYDHFPVHWQDLLKRFEDETVSNDVK